MNSDAGVIENGSFVSFNELGLEGVAELGKSG
jgi:hypothetical protein